MSQKSQLPVGPRCDVILGCLGLALVAWYTCCSPTPIRRLAVTVMQPQQSLEQQYQQWLSNYTAADPKWQTYCLAVLRDSKRYSYQGSQFSQDVFMFHNFYKHWPMQGKTGFYVESGANDPLLLSNTLFFDKCLNWKGLCIEPQTEYHKALQEKRSCQIVPECISSRHEVVSMSVAGFVSAVGGQGLSVQCAPLGDILKRYTNGTQHHIDLWFLDVEGHELKVLEGVDFRSTHVDAMVIEDHWLQPMPRVLDIEMGRKDFVKFHQLPYDSVFVRRGTPAAASNQTIWYPPSFESDQASASTFARANKKQLLIAWGFSKGY